MVVGAVVAVVASEENAVAVDLLLDFDSRDVDVGGGTGHVVGISASAS